MQKLKMIMEAFLHSMLFRFENVGLFLYFGISEPGRDNKQKDHSEPNNKKG